MGIYRLLSNITSLILLAHGCGTIGGRSPHSVQQNRVIADVPLLVMVTLNGVLVLRQRTISCKLEELRCIITRPVVWVLALKKILQSSQLPRLQVELSFLVWTFSKCKTSRSRLRRCKLHKEYDRSDLFLSPYWYSSSEV